MRILYKIIIIKCNNISNNNTNSHRTNKAIKKDTKNNGNINVAINQTNNTYHKRYLNNYLFMCKKIYTKRIVFFHEEQKNGFSIIIIKMDKDK